MFLRGKSHQRIEQQGVNPPGFTSGIILKPFRGSQNELNRERDSLFLQTMQFNLPKSTEEKKTLRLLIFFPNQNYNFWHFMAKLKPGWMKFCGEINKRAPIQVLLCKILG